jgi:hypothetical protein
MNNHIFLVIAYMEELIQLERVQRWITLTREGTQNKRLLAVLDRKKIDLIARKIELQDEMFEIQRSN